jgi:hypothetical protein
VEELQKERYRFLQHYIYYYQFHRHRNHHPLLLGLRELEIYKSLFHLYHHLLT